MKQNITDEQLNELSKKAMNKLEYWWVIKKGWTLGLKPEISLSIGQMIEFLDEHHERGDYIDKYFDNQIIIGENGHSCSIGIGWDGDELCDALWEAVKEILEGK